MKKFLIITGFLLLGILLLFSLRGNWERNRILKEEVASLQNKESNLRKEIDRLKELVEQGRKEERLEREARLMLGFKKRGERVVLVVPPTIIHPATATSEKAASSFLSKIKQIWYNLKQPLEKIANF